MFINQEKCTQCKLCLEACPANAISYQDGQLEISEGCLNTPNCTARQICPTEAIEIAERAEGTVICDRCHVACQIRPGKMGECRMYINKDGKIVRAIPVVTFEEVEEIVGKNHDPVIRKPLLTGIGAGIHTTDPPLIVQDKVHGVDVVTCVSEAHFLFSGLKVKIDCEKYVGEEGAEVHHKGTKVGMVEVEEYASKIIHIGGANTLTGKNGWKAAKCIADIANREMVELSVKGGSKLEIQVGEKPVVNGKVVERRGRDCGGGGFTLGRDLLQGLVDEVIEMGRYVAGRYGPSEAGTSIYTPVYTGGIQLRFATSAGCFFPNRGGAEFVKRLEQSPLEIIESIDLKKLKPGYTLLITDPAGERIAFFVFTEEGKFGEAEMPKQIAELMEEYKAQCERARVSAYYMAGAGGGARFKLVGEKNALRLSEAIRDKKASVTVGGAPTLILVGGGINFMVDVERVRAGSFHWTNHPATVSPLEWTLKLEDFIDIGGPVHYVRPLEQVLDEIRKAKSS